MASTRNRNEYDNRRVQRRGTEFENGNAARRLEEVPSQPKKKLSRTVRKNRARSMNMGIEFLVFLFLMCVLTTGACVYYLQLTVDATVQRSELAAKEIKLNELKADNDAYYNEVTTDIDLDEIRDKAVNKLGMQYPTEEQIKYYISGNNSYVRQYQDIPEK